MPIRNVHFLPQKFLETYSQQQPPPLITTPRHHYARAGYAISVYVLHQRASDDIVNELKVVPNVCNVKF